MNAPISSPTKAVHSHLQSGVEMLLVGEAARGSWDGGAPGKLVPSVWRPTAQDSNPAGKSWPSSARAPVLRGLAPLPCCSQHVGMACAIAAVHRGLAFPVLLVLERRRDIGEGDLKTSLQLCGKGED